MANPLDEFKLSKEDLSSITPANQKLIAEMEKSVLEFLKFQMKQQQLIESKKQKVMSVIDKGIKNADPKVKMVAANLYGQVSN